MWVSNWGKMHFLLLPFNIVHHTNAIELPVKDLIMSHVVQETEQ